WAIKREDRPAAFAGRSSFRLLLTGIPVVPIQASILSHAACVPYQRRRQLRPRDSEKPAGKDRENVGGEDRGALQKVNILASTLDMAKESGYLQTSFHGDHGILMYLGDWQRGRKFKPPRCFVWVASAPKM